MEGSQPGFQFPVLLTGRLYLREFNLEDAQAVFDILSRGDVNQWLETSLLQSIDEARARIRSRMSLFKDGMGYRWAVCLRQVPARVIGSCGYFSVRRGTRTVEIGYELHPDYWNRGLMTEALQEVIAFGFSTQNPVPAHRIEALVAPGNQVSIRLLEKLGFEREGLRREFAFWNGCYQDVYMYALLNSS